MALEQVPNLKGYTVEWAEEGNFFLSRRNPLFHSSTLNAPFENIATIDAPLWKQASSRLRPAQRLLRFMVTNVVPIAEAEIFVTFDKAAGVVRDGKYRPLAGMVRPCRVLRAGCAVDRNGNVFFGEYLANDERGEMRVYRFSPGSDAVEIVYTFPADSIKHVHGLYYDSFSDAIYCLTGDKENECGVLRTFDGFETVEAVGQGDETWRAVSILFSPDALFYGTDAEFRSNNIYRLDRQSGTRTSLGEVSGTVFYSKQIAGNMFFTTTAENAPSQKENVAALWNLDGSGKCEEVVKFEKDFWHPTLFMFGTIHFPYENRMPDELYFSVVGAKGDNQSFKIFLAD